MDGCVTVEELVVDTALEDKEKFSEEDTLVEGREATPPRSDDVESIRVVEEADETEDCSLAEGRVSVTSTVDGVETAEAVVEGKVVVSSSSILVETAVSIEEDGVSASTVNVGLTRPEANTKIATERRKIGVPFIINSL